MRLPPALSRRFLRPRLFTLMILVAVLAVGLEAKIRWDRCSERAGFYESLAKQCKTNSQIWNSWKSGGVRPTLIGPEGFVFDTSRDRFRDLAGRCERLRDEFRHAALNPLARMPAEIDPAELVMPVWIW